MASAKKPAAGKARQKAKPEAGKGKSAGKPARKKTGGVVREKAPHSVGARTRKTYNLSHDLIMEAKELLGAKTATAAIEESLRMAVFSQRIAAGAKRSFGRAWEDPFGEEQPLTPNVPMP